MISQDADKDDAAGRMKGDVRRISMLVLSRQLGQTIVIGDNIEVKVVGIGGGRVKLGIEAPRQISVNRREIQDRIFHNAQTHGIGNTSHSSA
jgi:carbon storage regulator